MEITFEYLCTCIIQMGMNFNTQLFKYMKLDTQTTSTNYLFLCILKKASECNQNVTYKNCSTGRENEFFSKNQLVWVRKLKSCNHN